VSAHRAAMGVLQQASTVRSSMIQRGEQPAHAPEDARRREQRVQPLRERIPPAERRHGGHVDEAAGVERRLGRLDHALHGEELGVVHVRAEDDLADAGKGLENLHSTLHRGRPEAVGVHGQGHALRVRDVRERGQLAASEERLPSAHVQGAYAAAMDAVDHGVGHDLVQGQRGALGGPAPRATVAALEVASVRHVHVQDAAEASVERLDGHVGASGHRAPPVGLREACRSHPVCRALTPTSAASASSRASSSRRSSRIRVWKGSASACTRSASTFVGRTLRMAEISADVGGVPSSPPAAWPGCSPGGTPGHVRRIRKLPARTRSCRRGQEVAGAGKKLPAHRVHRTCLCQAPRRIPAVSLWRRPTDGAGPLRAERQGASQWHAHC
jgi:hypothetical protein